MKQLREGFTTGSCAAAAALACCIWQRDGECPDKVELVVPAGKTYSPQIIPHEDGSCGVIKFSGDDPDITNGHEVTARVELTGADGDICFKAGKGVGTITEFGMKVPVGDPAINPVPRRMITEAVHSVFPGMGAVVTVSVPDGEKLALKTFNPRLGITGGISILGTSGIVRPMSEEALCDSLRAELEMRVRQGYTDLIFTFGNQGEEALKKSFPDKRIVQVSNYIGFMLDAATELGVKRLVIGGHPGKMTKIAAGMMQTHSHTGDVRREAIITQLALMSAPLELIEQVYACITTDAAMKLIDEYSMNGVWKRLAYAARHYCQLRVRNEISTETVIADAAGKILGTTLEEFQ